MKFSEKLGAHLTPEWRQQYISYVELKNMLLNATEHAPIQTMVTSRMYDSYYESFEEEFFFECDKELHKINTFYAEKLAEATRRNEVLALSLDEIVAESRLKKRTLSRINAIKVEKKQKNFKKSRMESLRNAYSELYLSLVLLQNFKVLNHTGFRKILKKHDKLLNNDKGMKWFNLHVDTAFFYKNADLDKLIDEVEYNVIQYLENGDRAQGMKRLRVPPLEETQHIGTVFKVGFFIGAFSVMLAMIFVSDYRHRLTDFEATYGVLLFRGTFFVVMYLFLLGINVLKWRQYGVNHILIFEIDPRKHLTYSHLLELHGIFGVLWAFCVVCFVNADDLLVSRYWFPLIMVIIILLFLLCPFQIFHSSGRLWLLRLMGRVSAAPFYPVNFADFWFGDQLNSLVICITDIKYLLCFYVFNPTWSNDFNPSVCKEKDHIGNFVVRCLPAWFRFAQCLRRYRDTRQVHPFLVNAGKYFSSFPAMLFGALVAIYKDDYTNLFDNPYVWCYLIFATIQTTYCLFWDFLRDFSLFENLSGNHIFLRDHIIYPASFYYFVIVENFVLRFFWALGFYLVEIHGFNSLNVESVAGVLEVTRRYIWNYIRLENEHLFNVGNFRAVRDIFIAPINIPKSPGNVERMMDEDDGVKNRKVKIKETIPLKKNSTN